MKVMATKFVVCNICNKELVHGREIDPTQESLFHTLSGDVIQTALERHKERAGHNSVRLEEHLRLAAEEDSES